MVVKDDIMSFILIIACSVVFSLGVLIYNYTIMSCATLTLFFTLWISAYKKRATEMVYFGFLSTFFVFLLGRFVFEMDYIDSLMEKFGKSTTTTVFINLYISLIATWIGRAVRVKKIKYIRLENYSIKNARICDSAKVLYYITYVFQIMVNLEKAVFVQMNSYIELYNSFNSVLPWYFHKIAECNIVCMCVVFATMPPADKIKKVVVLYIISQFIAFLSGVRGEIAYAVVFIILYYYYRQKITDKFQLGEVWIGKGTTLLIIIFAPCALIFLSLYTYMRSGIDFQISGIFSELIGFFTQQGFSVELIAYADAYKEKLFSDTENISYLFGPVINLLKFGGISRLFGGNAKSLNLQQSALSGNNLGATITYFVMQNRYLNGEGFGTQYIAEAYADFGYAGVIVFGVFLGILIKKVNYYTSNKWYINALGIMTILEIVSMPRNFGMTFFSNWISAKNWLLFGAIYVLARTRKHKRRNYENSTNKYCIWNG